MTNRRIRKLWQYLRPNWTSILIGVVSLFIVNVLGVYIPLMIKNTTNTLSTRFELGHLQQQIILLAVLISLMWAIRIVSRIALFGAGRQVEIYLKQKIFDHLLKLEPSYFSINTSGDLINRSTSDVENIRRLVGFALLSLINTIFAYALTLPAMLALDLPLSLMALSVYPLMLITVKVFSGKLRDQQSEIQKNLSDLSEMIQEDISGIALIKIYSQEENERAAFNKKNQALLQSNLKLVQTRNFLFAIVEGITSLSLLILLWAGGIAIFKGQIKVGDFLALLILIERLVFPTALLGFTITAYQRGEVSIDRIEEIFQSQPKISNIDHPLALSKNEVKGAIKAINLNYTYPGSLVPALKNLNFEINPGELIAIVGGVGSGKSTLANAIPRMLDIAPDQLFIDGQDITSVKLEDLRRAIAYVPQESFLFSTDIRNNIRYGDPLAENLKVERSAKLAQIHQEILNFPEQYDSLVGERGITLSGGQRQRMSLARALTIDAPIIILDDCLASVDNQTASEILKNFSNAQGKTIVFISHQLSAAAKADRIFVMEKGEIVQIGTHSELLEQTGLYQFLWQQNQLEKILQ